MSLQIQGFSCAEEIEVECGVALFPFIVCLFAVDIIDTNWNNKHCEIVRIVFVS